MPLVRGGATSRSVSTSPSCHRKACRARRRGRSSTNSAVRKIPLARSSRFRQERLHRLLGTLRRDTHRYAFTNAIEVNRSWPAACRRPRAWPREQAEDVFDSGRDAAKRSNLRLNGATEKEIEFLLDQRVELNALTSDQLVSFVERKLKKARRQKSHCPGQDWLSDAYRMFARGQAAEHIIERELKKLNGSADNPVPRDLTTRVREHLKRNSTERWDDAIAAIAQSAPRIRS